MFAHLGLYTLLGGNENAVRDTTSKRAYKALMKSFNPKRQEKTNTLEIGSQDYHNFSQQNKGGWKNGENRDRRSKNKKLTARKKTANFSRGTNFNSLNFYERREK
jgi:hypothetical protein